MKKVLLGIILFMFVVSLFGQQKANYRLADKFFITKMGNIVPSRDVKPGFLKDSDKFWYTYKTCEGKNYYFVDPKSGKRQILFDPVRLAEQLGEITNKAYNSKDINIVPSFTEEGKNFRFQLEGKTIEYSLASGKCRVVPKEELEKNALPKKTGNGISSVYSLSPDKSLIVYTKDHNLWLKKSDEPDSLSVQLTADGCRDFSYSDDDEGENARVFTTKARWIKGQNRLYVLRVDKREVGTLPVVETLSGRPRLLKNSFGSSKYMMPGDKAVLHFELSFIDAGSRVVTKVNLDKWRDQKVQLLHVSADNHYLYIQRTKRTCDELDLCKVDTYTGEVTVILHETCKPYINDRMQAIRFLNDDQEFLWWSERTGWGHYYLYSSDGTFRRAVTSGAWTAGEIMRIDSVKRELYVLGYGREENRHPYYAHLYKASLDKVGTVKLLTPEDANHKVTMSPSGKYFIDTYSRVDLAPHSILRDKNGKLVCELAEADLTALYATGWKMPERFMVKAADGVTDLYGVMWKPFDFDSTRHYPIISYVYPGPQQDALPVDFTITGNDNCALAQVGFIVVTIGHRGGTPIRGHYYGTFGFGNLRDYPLADNKFALEQLADRHPFVDISRVGIFGHSGGAFMSVAALCTYPDFYKAAVATSGNHDNNIYNQAWGETFHGVSEEVKGKDTVFTVKIPTNMELVKNLKGHLLIVTGEVDNNVHPAHTYRVVDALLKAGKYFEMYVLPGQQHMYKGAADVFMRRKLWFHFAKHLLGDYTAESFSDMEEFNQLK